VSVAEIFSANSDIYATAVNERFYTRIAAALAEKVAARLTPRRILEVGAGTGAATVVLKRYFPLAEILATDPSERMLAHNRKKGLHGVRYACFAAEELRSPNEGFDLIFGNICYHWFLPGTARNLAELLAPGGIMAFSVSVSGPEKEDGNIILLRICRELSISGRQGKHLLSLIRLRREFACFPKCIMEKIALRETHPPALFGTLLRARGSWAFLFGPRAEEAEHRWWKLTAGRDRITLYWHIALVVVEK